MVNKTKTLLAEFLAACETMDTTRARLVENEKLFSPPVYAEKLRSVDLIKEQIGKVQEMSAVLTSIMTSALPPSHASLARVQKTMTGAATLAMQGATGLMRATSWKLNRDIDLVTNPTERANLAGIAGGAHFALLGMGLDMLSSFSGRARRGQ